MKRILITTALLAAFAAASVFAYPGAGMGYGMMGGYGAGPGWEEGCHADAAPALNLSSEQQAKLDDIQRDLWRRQQALMVRMHDQDFHMHDLYAPGVDEARAKGIRRHDRGEEGDVRGVARGRQAHGRHP